MISRPLALGLLAASCVSAAAGGAYVAVRQNPTDRVTVSTVPADPPSSPAVAETEAVVAPPSPAPPVEPIAPAQIEPAAAATTVEAPRRRSSVRQENRPAASRRPTAPAAPAARQSAPPAPAATDAAERTPVGETATPALAPVELPLASEPRPVVEPSRAPELVEVVVPTSTVLGLQVETAVSTERARVEDRVEARVTRDVNADGRVAIPAGSRALGSVTLVEKGGKLKERARLGVRFHTIVLADGSEIPIRTESVFREGDSPSGESARKIGGAAIGGAILGALIGGGKGAAVGGAAGAAGGTAVVMAGDRNAATLAAGTVVSVRLSSPVTLAVERQ
jgi:type IV secretory pathway VirB10-like protein